MIKYECKGCRTIIDKKYKYFSKCLHCGIKYNRVHGNISNNSAITDFIQ